MPPEHLPGFPLVTGEWWTEGDDLVVEDVPRFRRAHLSTGATAAKQIAEVLARCSGHSSLEQILEDVPHTHEGLVIQAMQELHAEGFILDGRTQSRRLLSELQRPVPVGPADLEAAYRLPLWRDARETRALDVLRSSCLPIERSSERRHSLPIDPPTETVDPVDPRDVLNVLASTYRTDGLWKPIASAGRLWPLVFHSLLPGRDDYSCAWFDPDRPSLVVVSRGITPSSVSSLMLQGGGLAATSRRLGVIVVSADISRVERKYGNRGAWFSLLEAGAAGHQISLSAGRHGLKSRPIGGFAAHSVRDLINADVDPLLLVLLASGRSR